MYKVLSFTSPTSSMVLDIMCDGRWLGQMKFVCTPGKEYDYDEIKASAMERRPSLRRCDFVLVPTDQKV